MNKLVLAAGLCAMALVLTPLTSASAEESSGRCIIEGAATFSGGHLKPVPTSNLGYEFRGSAECETLPTREVRKGTVEVTGKETLSCAGSLGEAEGEGTLTLGGVKFPFGLTFVAGGPGSTMLLAKFANGGVAVGTATFLKSVVEPASQCFLPGGAAELEFKAVATGEL
jgi:hypothetical protein